MYRNSRLVRNELFMLNEKYLLIVVTIYSNEDSVAHHFVLHDTLVSGM